jgi:hypothetical protein
MDVNIYKNAKEHYASSRNKLFGLILPAMSPRLPEEGACLYSKQ